MTFRRRAVVAAALAPAAAHGQPAPAGLQGIGLLHPGPAALVQSRLPPFLQGLRGRGFVDGRNVAVLARAAEYDPAQIARIAAEFVARPVAVAVAVARSAVLEVRARSATLPIVALDLESDPVQDGFVASLARPGGNITGLFFDFPEFGAKLVELLLEVVPGRPRVGILWDPATGHRHRDAVMAALASRELAAEVLPVTIPAELDVAFATAGERVQGLIVLSSPIFGTRVAHLAELSLARRLPTITMFPEFAEAGGLAAYGTSLRDLFRQAGDIAGRILAGARPADLPVQRPTRFQLLVNLRTAEQLGVSVANLVVRADEVIE